MKITNMEWDPNLATDSSEIFTIISTEIEEDLKALFSGAGQMLCHQLIIPINLAKVSLETQLTGSYEVSFLFYCQILAIVAIISDWLNIRCAVRPELSSDGGSQQIHSRKCPSVLHCWLAGG